MTALLVKERINLQLRDPPKKGKPLRCLEQKRALKVRMGGGDGGLVYLEETDIFPYVFVGDGVLSQTTSRGGGCGEGGSRDRKNPCHTGKICR